MRWIVSILILLSVCQTRAAEKPYLISGFDDVLRQAENTGLFKAAIKILEEDKTFTGMPELYSAISKEETGVEKFSLVSAISEWFEHRIDRFLKNSRYPSNHLHLRNWLTDWSIEKFKISKINEIIQSHPGKRFIIVFDNSDASLDLARKLPSQFPDHIVDIYLRQVVEKEVPAGSTSFYSAFDIALNEYRKRRMSLSEVESVALTILQESEPLQIFPSYAVCPVKYNPCEAVSSEVLSTCNKVRRRIADICHSNNREK